MTEDKILSSSNKVVPVDIIMAALVILSAFCIGQFFFPNSILAFATSTAFIAVWLHVEGKRFKIAYDDAVKGTGFRLFSKAEGTGHYYFAKCNACDVTTVSIEKNTICGRCGIDCSEIEWPEYIESHTEI